jgi:hypothetical protein
MTQRHRLNRGADRQANSALHLAVISRLRIDQRTQAYVTKKTTQGHSKLEIIRCLKRYLAREVYYLLNPGTPPTKGGGSRTRRAGTQPARTSLPQAGQGTQGQDSAARPTAPAA